MDDSKPRILCVGLVCTDIISVAPNYPEEDSDQRVLEQRWQRGGNASNMCTVLKQLGAPCEFFGTIATDSTMGFLTGDFAEHQIPIPNCVYHKDCHSPTSIIIINNANGSRTILHGNKNLPEITTGDFMKLDLNAGSYKWIHFEGRPSCDNIREILGVIDRHNASHPNHHIVTSVELEKKVESLAQLQDKADYVFISKEYAQYRGHDNMEDAVRELAKGCRKGANLICPWGEAGAMACSTSGHVICKSPSFPPPLVQDTLGAGDTFIAAAIHSLYHGLPLQEAITYGCKVAGAKVGMKGFTGLKGVFSKG